MDFDLNDEQRMIQDSARKFVAKHAVRKADEALPHDRVDAARWNELAEAGFLSIGQPASYGGIGGPEEIAIVCEAFGRGPILDPFIATAVFAAQVIAHAGSEDQKSTLLPAIASGEMIISVAYREPDGTANAHSVAQKSGDGYVLSGRKCLALAAPMADRLIVSASTGDALTLFLVEPKDFGVTIKPMPLVDGSWCGEIGFDKVRLPATRVLGRVGQGTEALRQGLRYAALAVCSEKVGLILQATESTSAYLKTRKQFGATLSSFQALRHKVADMAIDGEMAKAALIKLVASFQAPDEHDPEMSLAMAKVMLDDIGQRVCSQAVQLHGAMGLTSEFGIGRYYTRATLTRSLFGSTSEQLTKYSDLLSKRVRRAAGV